MIENPVNSSGPSNESHKLNGSDANINLSEHDRTWYLSSIFSLPSPDFLNNIQIVVKSFRKPV